MPALGKATSYDLPAAEAVPGTGLEEGCQLLGIPCTAQACLLHSHHHDEANFVPREIDVFCVWLTAVFSMGSSIRRKM